MTPRSGAGTEIELESSVQVLPKDLDSGKCARAPARTGGKVYERLKGAASARRPDPASFQLGAASVRRPRVGSASSEIVMLDTDGNIVVVNQAWRDAVAAYGLVLRDAGIGTAYVDVACRFLPDLDRAALELSLRPLLSGDADDVRHTYAIWTPRGLRWRHVQITPLSPGTSGRFVAIHDDLTELAMTQATLRMTSEQVLTARDEERQRIAIELHDSTNQHLAAMSMGLARLRRAALNGAAATAIIDEIASSLNETLKETRAISYLMNPRGLARAGLVATVRQFLEGFAQRTGLEVALEANAVVDRIPPPLQHAALRIIQEALMNAHRHAKAQRVSVGLAVGADQLTVSVADDGRGLPSDRGAPCLGVGIPGMRVRAQQFAGDLAISSDESGTRVVARLPLA
jgi:signal transduction histidine kinase